MKSYHWQKEVFGWKKPVLTGTIFIEKFDYGVCVEFSWLTELRSLWGQLHHEVPRTHNGLVFNYPLNTDLEQLKNEIDDFLIRFQGLEAFQ